MSIYSFVLTACNGRFDTRHFLVAGCCMMSALSVSISHSSVRAKSIGADLQYAAIENTTVDKTKIILPTVKPMVVGAVDHAPKIVSGLGQTSEKLTLFNVPHLENVSLQSDLELESGVSEFSAKDKKACSLDAAHAAAQGDTSKISPCLEAMLSGDDADLSNLPRKMADFFIETMNDPDRTENAPAKMINSMMAMMEAMTTKTDTASQTPSDTGSVE